MKSYLTFGSSAPGDSPPPLPGRMHRTASDIHNDLAKNNIILSDIHRAFVQDQGGSGNTHMSVSDSRTLTVTE